MPFIFCSCSTALNGLSSWAVVVGWLLGTLPTVAETSLVSCPKHRWESSPELVGRELWLENLILLSSTILISVLSKGPPFGNVCILFPLLDDHGCQWVSLVPCLTKELPTPMPLSFRIHSHYFSVRWRKIEGRFTQFPSFQIGIIHEISQNFIASGLSSLASRESRAAWDSTLFQHLLSVFTVASFFNLIDIYYVSFLLWLLYFCLFLLLQFFLISLGFREKMHCESTMLTQNMQISLDVVKLYNILPHAPRVVRSFWHAGCTYFLSVLLKNAYKERKWEPPTHSVTTTLWATTLWYTLCQMLKYINEEKRTQSEPPWSWDPREAGKH